MPPCGFAAKLITTKHGFSDLLYHALLVIQKLGWDSNGFQRNGHKNIGAIISKVDDEAALKQEMLNSKMT